MQIPTITNKSLTEIPAAMPYNAGMPTNLREATQEFESLFISQVMDAMRKTVPESSLMGASSGQKIFRQMLDQEMAKEISKRGGFGIGEMLYQQLSTEIKKEAGPEPTATKS